ncbi:MAG: c-type cytochrome [Anaerolineales bacterium]|nr:c-type cytochrome [Anaerolineales bacterium]
MSTRTRRGLITIGLGLAPFIIGLLLTYQIIRVPFPTDMEDSPAVGYQESPRLSPPEGVVPIQGEPVIPEEFPVNPIPSDEISLQRGKILYQIHCSLCHGDLGHGDGPLAEFFPRTPENLAGSRAAAEFDGSVYLAIRQGFGQMPALAENLTIREHWDVINYIRTLPTSDE